METVILTGNIINNIFKDLPTKFKPEKNKIYRLKLDMRHLIDLKMLSQNYPGQELNKEVFFLSFEDITFSSLVNRCCAAV